MEWDFEVDLVCTGAAIAGLAAAVSAVDYGGAVFVADGGRDRVDPLRPWLEIGVSDGETLEYLASLSSGVNAADREFCAADVPTAVVHEHAVEAGVAIAPFYGARLDEWAARCLGSPYGYLHTRVSDWRTTTFHTTAGESIEVAEIGWMVPDPGNVGSSLLDWLIAEARDRDIEIEPNCVLQRIVFEEGEAVGAVFHTPDGALAVRARHGVTVATGGPQLFTAGVDQPSAGDGAVRVCLVGRCASRFGRVELLTSGPAAPPPPVCRPDARQLPANLHESQGQSPTWRCGRPGGYPPATA